MGVTLSTSIGYTPSILSRYNLAPGSRQKSTFKAPPGVKNSPNDGHHVSEGGKNYGRTKVTRIVYEWAGLAFNVISGRKETD
jgi:hypothetical protein